MEKSRFDIISDLFKLSNVISGAFPGSGVGMPGCVIPPGEASEKGIAAVCPWRGAVLWRSREAGWVCRGAVCRQAGRVERE